MRQKNLDEIKQINYKIISLGLNCLPRTVLTRWGLKPTKKQGELSMPFDLATYETFTLTKCIENDFADFFEDIEFKRKLPFFWKGYWVKKPDFIEFIHERKLAKNNISKLTRIYNNRIQNFRNIVKEAQFPVFIQLIGDCEDVDKLYSAIKKLRENNPFKLLIVDTQNIVKTENTNIKVLKLPYPSEQYKDNWWLKKYYSSKEGQEFESKIADFCIEQIKDFATITVNSEYYK